MPEEKTCSKFEALSFPFENYIEEIKSPGDYNTQNQHEPDGLSRVITGTFEEKLEILKEAIEEIDSEIGIRKELSRKSRLDLNHSRGWLSDSLREFDGWQFGYKPSVDFRRTALERELLGIYREVRQDQQRTFSDIVSLKKERRSLLMEYKSLKATGKALAP